MSGPDADSIVELCGTGVSADDVGGKAINLSIMSSAGFRVPPAVAVTVRAYDDFITGTGLRDRIAAVLGSIDYADAESLADGTQRIRDMIVGTDMPDGLSERIVESAECLGGEYFAVRSSAVAEDLPEASFAGQQDTFLFIRPQDVPRMTVMCWASYWNERAVKYRQDAGVPHLSTGMAVVVQRMVASDASGVMFTANPVDGTEDVVVESAWGLGESIASGTITPDRFVLSRDGAVKERNVRVKDKGYFLSDGRNTLRDIPAPKSSEPSASDSELADVLDLGLRLESHFGCPQDVEWAVEGGTVYVLQSRAITTLTDESEKDGILWTRAYGDEYWADATTPMFFDVMGKMLTEYVNHEGAKMMGYKDLTSGPLIKLHKSRVYFNTWVLERVFSYYPKFIRSKELLNYFPLKDQDRISRYPSRMGKAVTSQIRVMFKDPDGAMWRTDRAYRKWAESFMETCRVFDSTDLAALSDAELSDLYRDIEAKSLKHYRLIRYGMVSHSIATNLMVKNWLAEWIGDGDGAYYSKLISGLEGNKTVETNVGFSEMAKAVRADPEVLERIHKESSTGFLEWLDASDSELKGLFDRFVDTYGHRSNTREISAPRWKEDRPYIVDVVRILSDSDNDLRALELKRRVEREEAESEVRRLIRRTRFGHVRCWIFDVVLGLAQTYLTFRENQRFYLDHILFRQRLMIREIGRRLAERGRIDEQDDVFFLGESEAFDILSGGSADGAAESVSKRKEEFYRYGNVLPPKFLKDGIDFDDTVAISTENAVYGTASSPGTVRGRVRVVDSVKGLSEIRDGDILVTSNTDPGWTAVFSRLGGLITETGGILSHGAVISREYRIPAVTAVKGATKLFITGQTVLLDGNDGVVYTEEESNEQRAP